MYALYYFISCSIILYHVMLCHIVSYCSILYYIISYIGIGCGGDLPTPVPHPRGEWRGAPCMLGILQVSKRAKSHPKSSRNVRLHTTLRKGRPVFSECPVAPRFLMILGSFLRASPPGSENPYRFQNTPNGQLLIESRPQIRLRDWHSSFQLTNAFQMHLSR